MSRSTRRGRRPILLTLIAIVLAIVLASAVTPGYAASLAVAARTLTVFNPANMPSACLSPPGETVGPVADSWTLEDSPSTNNGSDVNLFVRSGLSQNRRTFVRFVLPSLPAGCTVTGATLRLFAESEQGTRVIQAFRASGFWTENAVTWSNQPGTTGAAAASTSGLGWTTWDVTAQVQAMYVGTNFGFVLQDQTEGASDLVGFTQTYASREGAPNDPELIVTWG